jgi:hypothetical protein
MIEITIFGLMVMTLIAVALARDFWRARRDRHRAHHMDSIVSHYASQPVQELVNQIGEPYEMTKGWSQRALYIWKAPPNEKLPSGSGLLILIATVEADGVISEITWRDRM